mgnify:FL=1
MGGRGRHAVFFVISGITVIVFIGIGMLYSPVRWALTAEYAYHTNRLLHRAN